MAKKSIIAVLAVVVIGAAIYTVGKSCSRRVRSQPSDARKYWVLLSMGGFYQCPHCGEKVELTDEQLKLPDPPPELKCPHCNKAVDVVKLMAPRPAKGTKPPGKAR